MTPYRERLNKGEYTQTITRTTTPTVHEPIPDEADNAGDYHCPNCDKTFDSKRGLSRHQTAVHS